MSQPRKSRYSSHISARVLWALLVLSISDSAYPAAPTHIEPSDYTKAESWLCLPLRDDACAQDLTTTIIQPDGSTSLEPFKADPDAPIDCFYVYPTVSIAPGPNSPMTPSANEVGIVRHQASRFRSVCRLYAPMYRQVTASFALTQPPPTPEKLLRAREIAYADVRAAWMEYLAHRNNGRGVVLIGHSQGSSHLARLIREEIEDKPIQRRLISALLLGTDIAVPPAGGDAGGDFRIIPLCRNEGQIGCVVSFVSFRDRLPPPANSRFGRPRDRERMAANGHKLMSACVNPAAVAGGDGALKAYLGANSPVAGFKPQPFEWARGVEVRTDFVMLPGLLNARCITRDGFDYLEVRVNADANDPRANDIPGDFIADGRILYDWGLHIIDANLTIGNLIELVAKQRQTWLASGRKPGRRDR